MQGDLDQLWYTWSTNGLGSMPMGYRVRAASGELHDTQSKRYRLVDRFLHYQLPQGANANEPDITALPIAFSFVSNGEELLLIRKIFKGRDRAGRNSVHFTHLIAGLPSTFSARDAIRLWDSSDLWVESEEKKAASDTLLEPMAYTNLKFYADRAQAALSLPFTTIRQQLEHLLLSILGQNCLPQRVFMTGRSNLAAALIYGITHCLPMTLLGNFTFSTYESNPGESEATFVNTVTGAELADPSHLDIGAVIMPALSPTNLKRYKAYVDIALNYLVTGKTEQFLRFLRKMEAHNCQSAEQLLEEFNLEFSQGPLTIKQIEAIVTHADEHGEKLRDPFFQQQSAALLINQVEDWQQVGKVFKKLVGGANQFDQNTRQALATYCNGLAPSIIDALRDGLLQAKNLAAQGTEHTTIWRAPNHCGDLLLTLLPPVQNEQIWFRLFNDFAQPPLYTYIKSDFMWSFQAWLLKVARQLPQPQTALAHIKPWLTIPSWEKLQGVLALALPDEWAYEAISGLIGDIPRGALPIIQQHEKLFTGALRYSLQQGHVAITTVVSFFQKIVEYRYPNRVALLLALVNTYSDAGFVQTLFTCVDASTPYRLNAQEVNTVLAGCQPEVIATCSRAPALAFYLQEFVLSLTPARLHSKNTIQLLNQLNRLNGASGLPILPDEIADLVSHWQVVSRFMNAPALDRQILGKVKSAIERLLKRGSQSQVQTFADEFIPMLVKLARTEHDLESILDALGYGSKLGLLAWNLLRWMAIIAGQNGLHLYEAVPYVVCGIREAGTSGQSLSDLGIYLQALNLDKDALKSIDSAMASGIWPEAIRQGWENWRGQNKKSFPIPSLRNNTGRLPAEQQPIVLPGQGSYTVTNSEQATPAFFSPAQTETISQQNGEIVATLTALNRNIPKDEYKRMHRAMLYLLTYWLDRKFPTGSKNLSKSFSFEFDTIKRILQDIRADTRGISEALASYLADNLLIDAATRTLANNNKGLDPEHRLAPELADFQAFVQERQLSTSLINEALAQQGLRILIRRTLFIYHLDDQKGDSLFGKSALQTFLEKERKTAQYKFLATK